MKKVLLLLVMLTLFITSCNYKPHKRILNIHTHTHISPTETLTGEVEVNIMLDENLVQFTSDSTIIYTPNKVVRNDSQTTYFCSEFTLHHLPYERMVYVVTSNTQDIYEY